MRVVVTASLAVLALVLLWFATEVTDPGYMVLAVQLTLVGLGLGAVRIAATEAIMGVVPPENASLGSALNDASASTRRA